MRSTRARRRASPRSISTCCAPAVRSGTRSCWRRSVSTPRTRNSGRRASALSRASSTSWRKWADAFHCFVIPAQAGRWSHIRSATLSRRPGQDASESADGVFDAALLPGGVRITEEGFESEALPQAVVVGELGSVVEGDGLAQLAWQRGEHRLDGSGHGGRLLGGLTPNGEGSRRALMKGEDGLAIGAEEHEIGFPMAGTGTIGGAGRTLGDGDAVLDMLDGASAFATAEASLALAARQIEAPGIVLGAGDLSGDEAIDALVADDRATLFAGEPAGDLLRRPAAAQALEHDGLERKIAQQLGTAPAAGFGLLAGKARLVVDRAAAVSLQLPSDARWRAIQSCRNLPDRLPGRATLGNRAPLYQAKLPI